jgi:hypothetical protein
MEFFTLFNFEHISMMFAQATGGSVQFNTISNIVTHYKTTGITAHCEPWSSCGGILPLSLTDSTKRR